MGAKINYTDFIKEFDKRLQGYFDSYAENICCQKGCSDCCEQGDYPLTDIELEYLMQGFMKLDSETKIYVQKNIRNMKKGGACPFLINKECSVYEYRPIVCRVHGLAYFYKDEKVKLPYCVNNGKNFSKVYDPNEGFYGIPLRANLDTPHVLEGLYKKMNNLYDWLIPDKK